MCHRFHSKYNNYLSAGIIPNDNSSVPPSINFIVSWSTLGLRITTDATVAPRVVNLMDGAAIEFVVVVIGWRILVRELWNSPNWGTIWGLHHLTVSVDMVKLTHPDGDKEEGQKQWLEHDFWYVFRSGRRKGWEWVLWWLISSICTILLAINQLMINTVVSI